MQVRIAQHKIRDWRLGSSNLELRVAANESFVADGDGGVLVEAGAVYAKVACTVANETDTNGYTSPVLTIPAIYLYSTTDALVNKQATYRAAIYNSKTGKIVKQLQELNSFFIAPTSDDNWGNVIFNNSVITLSTRPNFDSELKIYSDATYMLKTGGSIGAISIGGGTTINKILRGTVVINPVSVDANTVSIQTFTLTGAVVGDSLVLNTPAAGLTAGLLVLQYFVSAADTITITFQNFTGAPIDEPSGSWTYMLVR